MSEQDVATNTSVIWGPIRLSSLAMGTGGNVIANPIDRPPTLEDTFRAQEPGAFFVEGMTAMMARNDLQMTMTTAHAARTAYPHVTFIRGTVGGLSILVPNTRLANIPDGHTVGEWRENEYTFAPGADAGHYMQDGTLFDHTMSHPSGVNAPVTGTPFEVGAVSATQSVKVLLANPHDPAPTWSGAAMQLESDPIEAFTTATLRGTAMTGMGSTASYELQTIAGPITDTWWRLNITTVPSGIGWPVCCMWIVDN